MDVLNPKTFDAEEDQVRERTNYSQMDRLLVPAEFQQQAVSTGVSRNDDRTRYTPHFSFQTTIIAVEFDGGVVIGADTRTSSG
jgi:hypothetical protein